MPRALAQARIASAWPGGAMFEVGFIELVDVVPLRADAFLAAVVVPTLPARGSFRAAGTFGAPFATFFAGTDCRGASAEGATTWVRLAVAEDTFTADEPAAPVCVAARFAEDLFVPG